MPELREIYEEFFSPVYNYVFYRLLHKEQTEDLTAEIFLKIVKNLHRYDESKAMMKTWIYAIADNTLIDYYRTRKPSVSIDGEDCYINLEDFEQQYNLIRSEDRKELFFALSKLNSREREILTLKYFRDMPVAEIAELLDINKSTVSTIHLRSLEKLKGILGEDFRLD